LWHFKYLIDTFVFSEWNGEIDGDSSIAIAISTSKDIYGSRNILLVITEQFLTRDWPFVEDGYRQYDKTQIRILLGECHISKEIQQLPVFDLTMGSRIPFEIQILNVPHFEGEKMCKSIYNTSERD
jgi:hypothetical protein